MGGPMRNRRHARRCDQLHRVAIEDACFPPLWFGLHRRALGLVMVARRDPGQHCIVARHEQVRHGVGVAAGTAQSHHGPAVAVDGRRRAWKQHCSLDKTSVGLLEGLAAVVAQPAMPAEPGGNPVTAGKGPNAADLPAAVNRHRQARRLASGISEREDGTGMGEYFLRNMGFHIRRAHCRAGTLSHAPGHAGIPLGNCADYLRMGGWVQLRAANRARHHRAEHLRFMQRIHQIGGERLGGFDLRSCRLEQRFQSARTRDPFTGCLAGYGILMVAIARAHRSLLLLHQELRAAINLARYPTYESQSEILLAKQVMTPAGGFVPAPPVRVAKKLRPPLFLTGQTEPQRRCYNLCCNLCRRCRPRRCDR